MLFPLLPDGAIYAIEDTQTSYWPEVAAATTSTARTRRWRSSRSLVDGLNHEEFVDEGYEPTYTDTHVVAVHCYHNLVMIEKGPNAEGSNKRGVLKRRYGAA